MVPSAYLCVLSDALTCELGWSQMDIGWPDLAKYSSKSKVFVRTGEVTPFMNIVPQADVIF